MILRTTWTWEETSWKGGQVLHLMVLAGFGMKSNHQQVIFKQKCFSNITIFYTSLFHMNLYVYKLNIFEQDKTRHEDIFLGFGNNFF